MIMLKKMARECTRQEGGIENEKNINRNGVSFCALVFGIAAASSMADEMM